MTRSFSPALLELDPATECRRIAETIRAHVSQLRRKGVVLGLSGGVDSSVTAALCVKALGPERVLGLLLPEKENSPESERLGRLLGEHLGVTVIKEELAAILEATGCYTRREAVIRSVAPEFRPGDKYKIVLPDVRDAVGYRLFSLVVHHQDGRRSAVRLPLEAYQTIVAATNFKQRVRKMMEYYHADRLRYAVAGTPNRLEYNQGFFVKNGDGSADLKPIAHLYKTQVYQLAEFLELPEEIRSRPPTTDTYPLEQSQEEFFFSLPLRQLDLVMFGLDHGSSAAEVAAGVGLTTRQVERVFEDIRAKRRAAAYLHQGPLLVEAV